MTTMASQITSLTVVYSTVYSDADQRKHQSSASLAFVCGIHLDRWIPRTKGQLRGKCFHLMTSSCIYLYTCIGASDSVNLARVPSRFWNGSDTPCLYFTLHCTKALHTFNSTCILGSILLWQVPIYSFWFRYILLYCRDYGKLTSHRIMVSCNLNMMVTNVGIRANSCLTVIQQLYLILFRSHKNVLASLNCSFEHGTLAIAQRRAMISFLQRERKTACAYKPDEQYPYWISNTKFEQMSEPID